MQIIDVLRSHGSSWLRSNAGQFYLKLAPDRTGRRGVDKACEVAIDGFPRSANTFAYCHFVLANYPILETQPWLAPVAHHMHTRAQFTLAKRLGVPTIMLLRTPLDAIVSLLVRQPSLSPSRAIREYIAFYQDVEVADTIAPFQVTTRHFSHAIRLLNARAGTTFRPGEETSEFRSRVLEMVTRLEIMDAGGGAPRLSHVAIPHGTRDQMKKTIEARIKADAGAGRLLCRAQEVHRRAISLHEQRCAGGASR